jgi:hypothetical protein
MTTIFGPLNPSEIAVHLMQCAAAAAKKKGLKGSDWYTPQELHDFLKSEHPATFELFVAFAGAFAAHADLNWKVYGENTGPVNPIDVAELEKRFQSYDAARESLLSSLGD